MNQLFSPINSPARPPRLAGSREDLAASSTPINMASPLQSTPTRSPIRFGPVQFENSKGITAQIETHQGKHCLGGWPGYIGSRGTQFNQQFNVSPNSIGLLSFVWETFDPELATERVGYWHVQTDMEIGIDKERVITIQYALESPGVYWIHAYPTNQQRCNVEISLRRFAQ